MKEDVKGLYAAIFLSAVAMLMVNWIWPAQESTEEKPTVEVRNEVGNESGVAQKDDDKLYTPSNRKIEEVEDVLKQDKRVKIKNDKGLCCGTSLFYEYLLKNNFRVALFTVSGVFAIYPI